MLLVPVTTPKVSIPDKRNSYGVKNFKRSKYQIGSEADVVVVVGKGGMEFTHRSYYSSRMFTATALTKI